MFSTNALYRIDILLLVWSSHLIFKTFPHVFIFKSVSMYMKRTAWNTLYIYIFELVDKWVCTLHMHQLHVVAIVKILEEFTIFTFSKCFVMLL